MQACEVSVLVAYNSETTHTRKACCRLWRLPKALILQDKCNYWERPNARAGKQKHHSDCLVTVTELNQRQMNRSARGFSHLRTRKRRRLDGLRAAALCLVLAAMFVCSNNLN